VSRITTKKVPALALVVVAILGMVAGVLAATITITQVNYQGEQGVYHNNTGDFGVTDDGLQVIANAQVANDTATLQIPASTVQGPIAGTSLTAGDWAEQLTFSESVLSTGASHALTITVRSAAGHVGTVLLSYVGTIKEPAASGSTGTTILLLDLGSNNITSPITVYVSIK
jgi:hypothetical protein